MKTILEHERILLIDGYACLLQATKKALDLQKKLRLKFTKNKEILNYIYHFFIVDVLDLIKTDKLKFRSTIVFYDTEKQNQLLKGDILTILLKKIKSTSLLPVFHIALRDSPDLPYAAERCLNSYKTNLRSFHKNIQANNLTALKNLYLTKVSLL